MSQETTLSNLKPQPMQDFDIGLTSNQGYALTMKIATMLSSSTIVPSNYINNIPNCIVALNMANRMNADVLQVMQNLYIVYGNPAWSSKFKIATANACGRFSALRFEFFGTEDTDNWGCYAWAIEKLTGERLDGPRVTCALAKQQGWWTNKGSKWPHMTQKMLMYRGGSWWVDLYAPELCMGLMTDDEARDIIDIDLDGKVTGVTPADTDTKSLTRKSKKVNAISEPAATELQPQEQQPNNPTTDPVTGEVYSTAINENETNKDKFTPDEMNIFQDLANQVMDLATEKYYLLEKKLSPDKHQEINQAISDYFPNKSISQMRSRVKDLTDFS